MIALFTFIAWNEAAFQFQLTCIYREMHFEEVEKVYDACFLSFNYI